MKKKERKETRSLFLYILGSTTAMVDQYGKHCWINSSYVVVTCQYQLSLKSLLVPRFSRRDLYIHACLLVRSSILNWLVIFSNSLYVIFKSDGARFSRKNLVSPFGSK